jgi:hypothetical protein
MVDPITKGVESLTNKKILNFFSNSNALGITLFIIFALVVLQMVMNLFRDRNLSKAFDRSTKEIVRLTTLVEKFVTEVREKDKKYMEEFRDTSTDIAQLRSNMVHELRDLENTINALHIAVETLHTYCMAKNNANVEVQANDSNKK